MGGADLSACGLDSTCIDGDASDDDSGVSPGGGDDNVLAGVSCCTEVATSSRPTGSPFLIVMGHSHGLKIRTGTCSCFGLMMTRAIIAPERRKVFLFGSKTI